MHDARRDTAVPAITGARILCRKQGGEEWLLIKDSTGEVAIERCPGLGQESERLSLENFLQRGKPRLAQDEFRRLVGTLIEEAEAGPETS